jgi:hypothetical protein
MAKETTQTGIIGNLQRLKVSTDANAAEIPHMEGTRLKLGTVLEQAAEISKQQAALTASRQAASKELQRLLGEGQRLATILRLGIKQHYGIRAEKLAEFHLQPFRGRPRVAKPVPEGPKLPPPDSPPATPTDSDTAS